MSTLYPTALDTSANLPSPSSSDNLENANALLGHSYQHDMLNSMALGLETWLGTSNTSVQDTLEWRMRHIPYAPRTPNAMDDEFDGSSSINTSLWTPFQQTVGAHVALAPLCGGSLVIMLPTPQTTGEKIRAFFQNVPTGDWTFETCVNRHGNSSGFSYCGMFLGSYSHLLHEFWGRTHSNAPTRVTDMRCTRLGAEGTFVSHHRSFVSAQSGKLYLRAQRSGSTLNYYWSLDGQYFELAETHAETNHLTGGVVTIGVGLSASNFSGVPVLQGSFEYFRRIA